MSVYHVVETGVVATVVAMSALSMMGRYAPVMRARAMARVRASIAIRSTTIARRNS
jgi:hypothetical protein